MAWDFTEGAPSAQCPIPGGYRRAETRHHRIHHPDLLRTALVPATRNSGANDRGVVRIPVGQIAQAADPNLVAGHAQNPARGPLCGFERQRGRARFPDDDRVVIRLEPVYQYGCTFGTDSVAELGGCVELE